MDVGGTEDEEEEDSVFVVVVGARCCRFSANSMAMSNIPTRCSVEPTSNGKTSVALPCNQTSAYVNSLVGLISMMVAPLSFAMRGSSDAGCTLPDVPTTTTQFASWQTPVARLNTS